MKTLLILAVAVIGTLAVDYEPPNPHEIIPTSDHIIRWCVHTPCEQYKCWRMANQFTYNIQPRKTHVCLMATSPDHCLNWIENGYADIVVARGEQIWKAHRVHHMKPIAYELPVYKGKERLQHWESISVAVVPKSSHISHLNDLENTQSCHAGVDHTSSWMSPMCSLIHNHIIPNKGNMVESAAHFFSKSCVPGVLDKNYDVNGTNPEHLCEICNGNKEDNSWCDKTRDGYSGFHGAGRCLEEGKGHVAFLDHNHIPEFKEQFGNDYKLVCKTGTADLDDWKVEDCHIGYVPRPTIFTHQDRSSTYRNDIWDILSSAVTHFSRDDNMNLFSSDDYICRADPNPTDLIFRDDTHELVHIEEDKTSYINKFLDVYDTCEHMTPKPRAKFCVVTQEAYTKCTEMKRHFYRTDKVNEVSWGCLWARDKMECMKAVHNGTADLISLDPMETFIAGHDFHLHPVLSQYFDVFQEEKNGKKSYNWDTETYTIGVMLKSVYQEKFGRDNDWVRLEGLNTCHSGISRVSAFHHPIGWLLANGTMQRCRSVFESVNRFFHRSCIPGAKHWDMKNDIVLGQEFNWGYQGITFYNFTGVEWFVWNVPFTWNYYNWYQQTPAALETLMRNEWMENSDGWNDNNEWNLAGKSRAQWRVWNQFKYNLRSVPEFILQRMPNIEQFWNNWKAVGETGEVTDTDYKWMKHPIFMSYMRVYHPEVAKRWINFFDNMDWLPVQEGEYNRYTNPIWLSEHWEEFQNNMKVHREELCTSCGGYKEMNCVEGTEEPYWGTLGSLRCVEEHRGDIAFLEAHKFEPYAYDIGLIPQDFVLVCPSGKVVHYVDERSIENCHLGRVPFPALVTSQRHTGSWRWNVTKALLHAQKIFDDHETNDFHFVMFGEHSVFHRHTTKLHPIHLINQTHHSWLGPMFLRSMEALVKPSNNNLQCRSKKISHGETFSNVIYQRDGRCNAIVKDVTCHGNPDPKTMYLGRIGHKYSVDVAMCSRPSRFMRKMVEFTCDTGYGYITPVMVPTECESVPCEDMTHAPDWSHDHHWTTDERKYEPNEFETQHMDLWGNKPWWMHRDTYDNWFHDRTVYPLNQDWNMNQHRVRNIDRNDWWSVSSDNNDDDNKVCEKFWSGTEWHGEWYPHMHHNVCNRHGNRYNNQDLNTKTRQ